jgi:hypothetical protein
MRGNKRVVGKRKETAARDCDPEFSKTYLTTATDNTHTHDLHTVSIPENPVRHFPHVFFVSKQGSLCNAVQLGELEQFTVPRMEATWNLKNKKEIQKKE